MNQCDGCMRGLRLENGVHMDGRHLVMSCSRERYESEKDFRIDDLGNPSNKFKIICPKCNQSTDCDSAIERGCSVLDNEIRLICGHCGFSDKSEMKGADGSPLD
jgi:hypothetical protein